ncbi:MAG: YciI family protein [Rhodococcus sp. (in: high G+C Gram-positive bacteria)]
MAFFLVDYTYTAATADGRDRVRAAHRDWLLELLARDVVQSAGPHAADAGATIVVRGESTSDVTALFAEDPFAQEGLVEAVRVTEWKPVMGLLSD